MEIAAVMRPDLNKGSRYCHSRAHNCHTCAAETDSLLVLQQGAMPITDLFGVQFPVLTFQFEKHATDKMRLASAVVSRRWTTPS
jgi:hypothetical protein